jgi:hypothetical protein
MQKIVARMSTLVALGCPGGRLGTFADHGRREV